MWTKQQIDTNNAISICFRPFILAICENIVRTRSSLRNSDQFTIRWLHKPRRQNWCRLTAFQQRTKKHQQNWQFDKLETFFWSNFRFYREKKKHGRRFCMCQCVLNWSFDETFRKCSRWLSLSIFPKFSSVTVTLGGLGNIELHPLVLATRCRLY